MTNEEVHDYPGTALEYCSDKLTAEQLDYCVHEYPATAIACCSDKLTEQQFDVCLREEPWIALEKHSDKLTKSNSTIARREKMNFEELTPEQRDIAPEQLRCCVREMPGESLKYYSEEELAGKQLEYCEEKTK